MLRTIHGQSVYIGIPSRNRVRKVEPMQAFLGDVTWHVLAEEEEAYREAGAAATVVAPAGIAPTRNSVLEAAAGAWAFMPDDDIKSAGVVMGGELVPCSVLEAVEELVERALLTDYNLAGPSLTQNPSYVGDIPSTRAMIINIVLVKPTELRYDERFDYQEDIDFCLQHINRDGGVLRCNNLMIATEYGTPGGISDSSLADKTRAEADYASAVLMRQKWPTWVHTDRNGKTFYRPPADFFVKREAV